jgi:hypothetical protein
MAEFLTRCCNAPYGVGGKGTTHWYLCTSCEQPTHIPGFEEAGEEELLERLLQSEHAVG